MSGGGLEQTLSNNVTNVNLRQISGAMIRISNCEDRDAPANLDRTITISGNCESVALAQYLINMRSVAT